MVGFVKFIATVCILALAVTGVVYVLARSSRVRPSSATHATVRVPEAGYEVRVEVARTPAQRERGLSGRDALAPGTGMLFIFDMLDQHKIWMRDMRFPIDIVWIAGGVIVDVHEHLPVSPPGTDLRQIPYFNPRPQAILAVELPAGDVARHGLNPGRMVEVIFDGE